MNSSTNPRKRVKVKLLRVEDLLWDQMETIGVLLVEQSQVALGVQEVLVTGDHLVEDLEVRVVQVALNQFQWFLVFRVFLVFLE